MIRVGPADLDPIGLEARAGELIAGVSRAREVD